MYLKKSKVVLVRHGSTIYSEQGRLYNGEDYPPLNLQGKKQMEMLSKWLINNVPHVSAIYTSASLRSIQSARIISKVYDLDYKIEENLYERKAGLWAGLTFDQIEEKYPEMLEEYHKNPCNYWPEGGETTKDVRARVNRTISELIPQYKNQTIIIVTHKSVIQSAIADVLDISQNYQGRIVVPTGSASQINYFENWATIEYTSFVPQ